MSARLDDLIAAARDDEEGFSRSWDGERAVRVREGALRRSDLRARRDRALRRGLVVAGGAGLLVLALLRAASSAPGALPTPTAEALAFRTLADAGYARD